MIAGQLRIEIDHCVHALESHDSLTVLPGTHHRVENVGSQDAVFLVISAPSSRDDRVDALPNRDGMRNRGMRG